MKKMHPLTYIAALLSLIFTLNLQAQSKVLDSLRLALVKIDTPDEKVQILNQIGQYYLEIKPAKGIKYVQKALELAAKNNFQQQEVESLLLLGKIYTSEGKVQVAEQRLTKALRLCKGDRFTALFAKIQLGLGVLKATQGKYVDAAIYLNQALQTPLKMLDKAEALFYLGLAKQMTDHNKEGLLLYKKALKIYQSKQRVLRQSLVYAHIARIYQNRDQLDSAFLMVKKGLILFNNQQTQHAPSNEKAHLLYRKGYILQKAGNIQASVEAFWKAFEIYKKLDKAARKVAALTAIGYSYYLNGDYDNANKIYQKAETITKPNDASFIHAELLLSIGNCQLAQKKYALASQYYDQAFELFKQLNHSQGQAKILLNKGWVFKEQNQYKKALTYFQKAKAMVSKGSSFYFNSFVEQAIIGIYIKQGKFNQASTLLNKLKGQIQGAALKKANFQLQYQLDSAKTNYASALKWYKQFKQLDDSITKRQSTLLLHLLKIQQAVSPLQDSSEIRVKDNTLPEKHSLFLFTESREYTVFVSVFALLLLLVLILQKYGHRKKIREHQKHLQIVTEQHLQQLNKNQTLAQSAVHSGLHPSLQEELRKKMTQKDHELAVQAMQLLQKNQILEDTLKNLKRQLKTNKDLGKAGVREIIKSLKKEVDPDRAWKRFYHSFEIAHPDFYNRLQAKHAELTEHDLKLGALIRLGLETAELASFLNITQDSVRKARFRLRRKMSLQDEQLNEYLRNL